jgi:hypothetical protein
MKQEPCHGGKKSKECLTILLYCNSDDSEKLKLLVIRKYSKPWCFKKILHCHANMSITTRQDPRYVLIS